MTRQPLPGYKASSESREAYMAPDVNFALTAFYEVHLMGTPGGHRTKSPAWRYGHTRPGNERPGAGKLTVEAKPQRALATSSPGYLRQPTLLCASGHVVLQGTEFS
jgi:hypothetical protein